MTERPANALAVAGRLIPAFEHAGIEYAIGGALCLGLWTQPRGTDDVDLTAFVAGDELGRLFDALRAAGCVFEEERARHDALARGVFAARHSGLRVDVYIPDIPPYETARARRRQVDFWGRPAWIWSAEDLCLFKLLYDRPKDRVDVEAVLATLGERFETRYLRDWLVRCVGEDDHRVRWLDERIPR